MGCAGTVVVCFSFVVNGDVDWASGGGGGGGSGGCERVEVGDLKEFLFTGFVFAFILFFIPTFLFFVVATAVAVVALIKQVEPPSPSSSSSSSTSVSTSDEAAPSPSPPSFSMVVEWIVDKESNPNPIDGLLFIAFEIRCALISTMFTGDPTTTASLIHILSSTVFLNSSTSDASSKKALVAAVTVLMTVEVVESVVVLFIEEIECLFELKLVDTSGSWINGGEARSWSVSTVWLCAGGCGGCGSKNDGDEAKLISVVVNAGVAT
jgi:hypothetical protein